MAAHDPLSLEPAELTEPDTAAIRRRQFHLGLITATLLPLLSLPFLAAVEAPFGSSFMLGLAIFIGGVGHVASTATVYADQGARELMADHPLRFKVVPLVTIAFTMVCLAWGASMTIPVNVVAGFFLVHLLWLHYHYQKQNYGLIAFAAAGNGHSVPRVLATAMLLPALAGCVVMIPALVAGALPEIVVFEPYRPIFHTIGIIIYVTGALAMASVIMRKPAVFRDPLTGTYTAGALLFFLPPILLDNPDYAFWSYAIAHGFQYLFMVRLFTANGGPKLLMITAFLIAVAAGGLFLHKLAGNHALFLCGIFLTWVHFILDAKLWRMSENKPRRLITKRFAFIFNPTGTQR
ncbi:MAG: hypothetical protein AAF384_19930 [Pseudomonadota bacterium]